MVVYIRQQVIRFCSNSSRFSRWSFPFMVRVEILIDLLSSRFLSFNLSFWFGFHFNCGDITCSIETDVRIVWFDLDGGSYMTEVRVCRAFINTSMFNRALLLSCNLKRISIWCMSFILTFLGLTSGSGS